MQQYQNPNKIPVIVRADFLLDGRRPFSPHRLRPGHQK